MRDPKSKSRKSIVKKLDEIFSIYVRMKTKKETGALCPLCHKRPIEHCFHFITRAKYITRWDVDNAIGSCSGCNLNNEYNPSKYIKWYIDKHGYTKFSDLETKSNNIYKFPDEELENMTAFFKTEIERMNK